MVSYKLDTSWTFFFFFYYYDYYFRGPMLVAQLSLATIKNRFVLCVCVCVFANSDRRGGGARSAPGAAQTAGQPAEQRRQQQRQRRAVARGDPGRGRVGFVGPQRHLGPPSRRQRPPPGPCHHLRSLPKRARPPIYPPKSSTSVLVLRTRFSSKQCLTS